MQTKWKVTLLTLVIAIPAFMFGGGSPQGQAMWDAIWPFGGPGETQPVGAQLPLLLAIGAMEGIALGLAVSLLVFGSRLAQQIDPAHRGRMLGMTVAVAWLLGNWWVHTSLHIVNGEHSMWGLITIEYAFHVTLMAAGAYLAWGLSRMIVERSGPAAAPVPASK